MKILSVQSSVAYGHVGNSAAVFPLQRLGHEVWPVLTVHFSNHTGYGAWRGPLLDPADVREVIAGIDDRGALAGVDAVLSGYQGDPAVGALILDAVARVKELNPEGDTDPQLSDRHKLMRFDLDDVGTQNAYKLLAATVMPRPIAWVVTQDLEGTVNAAPFSFFNVMGSAPPTVALGILADRERGFKDTARNILDTEEFVVNLVPERLVGAMNVTAVDAPRGVDELALANLATAPSSRVRPPRIAESPVNFECVLTQLIQLTEVGLIEDGLNEPRVESFVLIRRHGRTSSDIGNPMLGSRS